MFFVETKQAHHKAGGAEAALRTVALQHGLLGRVQCAVCGLQVFHRPQRQPVHRMRHADAAIDGLQFQLAVFLFTDDHGAGPAVAFAAALLGAGAVQVFAQQVEQGAVGVNGQTDKLTTAQKADDLGIHKLFQKGCSGARVNRECGARQTH